MEQIRLLTNAGAVTQLIADHQREAQLSEDDLAAWIGAQDAAGWTYEVLLTVSGNTETRTGIHMGEEWCDVMRRQALRWVEWDRKREALALPLRVVTLHGYGGMCPTQGEGTTDDGRPVYVRYRMGFLSVRVGEPGEDEDDAVGGVEVVGRRFGDDLGGDLDYDDMRALCKGVVEFPDYREIRTRGGQRANTAD